MPLEHEHDLFEAAYLAGVAGEPERPAAAPARELRARLASPEAVALKGCVLTPARALDPGYVVVEGDTIRDVTATAPQGVAVTDTGGVITPGLIDLHGHPEFNV